MISKIGAQPRCAHSTSCWYRAHAKPTMKDLVEAMVKALVDYPDQVQVRMIEGEETIVFEVRVDPTDLGKVIGREGRMAKAIRTILGAVGTKLRKRIALEILE